MYHYLLAFLILPLILYKLYGRYNNRQINGELRKLQSGPPTKLLVGNALDFKPSLMHEWTMQYTRSHLPSHTHNWYYYILSDVSIVINNPFDLNYILDSHQNRFGKSDVYGKMLDWCSTGSLLQTDGQIWTDQRKVLSHAFSMKSVQQMYGTVIGKAQQLVQQLNKQLTKSSTVDISVWVACYTQDIIGSVGFHYEMNSLSGDLTYRHAAEDILRECWARVVRLFPFQDSELQSRGRAGIQLMHNTIKTVIAQRQSAGVSGKDTDILAVMMRAADDPSKTFPPAGYDLQSQYVNQTLLFLIAGADTTSSALNSALYFLAKYPQYQHKLRDELNTLDCTVAQQTYVSALGKLPYMNAIINETLRLRPSASTVTRKLLKSPDNANHTIRLPSGLLVTDNMNLDCQILQVQTSTQIWGNDAHEFKPDRWLQSDIKFDNQYELKHVFLPFLHGPRACIGQYLAKIEMLVAIDIIVRQYEQQLVKEPQFECAISMAYTDGLYLKCTSLHNVK